jgi:fucose permease
MSGIHGVWSAGLLASSGAAVVAAALDTSLVVHFGIVATVVAVASLRLLCGLLNPRAEDVGERAPSGGSVSWPAVLPLGLIGFCSFLGEGSMHDWSAVYLNETLGASPAIAAIGFAGFALGMTVSRFVADRLIVRYGSVRVVRAGGLVASAGLVLGLVLPGAAAAIAGFTVLGAALAPVVPTVFSAAGNVGAGATALGWVVTISYVGGILGPGLIGFTAQVTGLRTALGIPAALALVIAALAGRVVTAPGSPRRGDVPPAPAEGPW